MDDTDIQLKLDEIADEFLSRRRDGEKPTIQEYKERYPKLADKLEQTLKTIQFVDELGQSSDLTQSAKLKGQWDANPEIADFRIVRKIGQGGMGVVFEAEQESLGRRVALKVLPPHISSNEKFIERFKREARAAAKLHHTNIVPVFEVGREGETLFYAMQFIEGQPLDEVIKEVERLNREHDSTDSSSISRWLSGADSSGSNASNNRQQNYFKSVARLGAAVADALGYAHDRSIIHRDVKPSNLILDKEGVVWLADFGLAKTTESELTETGDFLGTARYMSPERFKGPGDHLGDIYSLGITLYELATLRRPFDAADRMQLIDQIANHDPRRPVEVNRSIPLDLETIILKSMDKDPRRRYQSAEELAADLRRFADDQPVQARRASTIERAIRWIRGHRAQTAAMVSMALAIAVLVVSSILIAQQRDIANENFIAAQKQEQKADDNFQMAFDAVDRYFIQVSEDTLLNEPGMEALRAELLNSAREFFVKFIQQRKDDPNVRNEYAGAVYRHAVIVAETGSIPDAIELLSEFVEDFADVELDSVDPELVHTLVLIHQALGTYTSDLGDHAKGLEILDRGIRIANQLVSRQPENWEYQMTASVTLGKQVRYYASSGDLDKALEVAKAARAVLEELEVESINDFKLWTERGLASRLVGAVCSANGQYENAITQYQAASVDYKKALEIRPESAKVRRYIANADGGLAAMQNRVGRHDEALKSNLRAIEMFHQLNDEFPRVSAYQHELSNRCASLGHGYWAGNDFDKALEQYLKSLGFRLKLVENNPDQLDYFIRLGRIYQNIGLTYGNLNNHEKNEEYYKKAIEVGQQVCERQPDNPRLFSDLSRYQSGLSNLYVAQNKFEEAQQLLESALEFTGERYRANPQVVDLGIAMIEGSASLGDLLLILKKYKKAIEVLEEGRRVGLETLERAKDNQSILRQLWSVNLSRAEGLLFLDRLDDAVEGKRLAIQYGVNSQRKFTAKLETKQMEIFAGHDHSGLAELIQSIPQGLKDTDGRIQLELATLAATQAVAIERDETLNEERKEEMIAKLESDCISHLEKYCNLNEPSAQSIASIMEHPFYSVLSQRGPLQDWATAD